MRRKINLIFLVLFTSCSNMGRNQDPDVAARGIQVSPRVIENSIWKGLVTGLACALVNKVILPDSQGYDERKNTIRSGIACSLLGGAYFGWKEAREIEDERKNQNNDSFLYKDYSEDLINKGANR